MSDETDSETNNGSADKESKGSKIQGSKIPNAKLTPEEVKQLPNLALIKHWSDRQVEGNPIVYRTYESYIYRGNALSRWLVAVNKKIIELTVDDVLEYKRWMELQNQAKQTMEKQLMLLRNIFEYLDIIKVREYSWPRVIRYRRYKDAEEYRTPTPAQVFAIRRRSHSRVRDIVLFEMQLSSGCRVSELLQLRASDIDFTHKVVDKEQHKLSPYIGGHFTLLPKKNKIKTQRGRVCYFSVIAAKYLKIYMQLVNYAANPHIPLFPFNRNSVNDWMYSLAYTAYTDMPLGSKVINEKLDEMKRQPGFADVEVDALEGVPDNIKKMIRTSQGVDRRRQERNEMIGKLDQLQFQTVRKHRLHNHALRNFFAGAMFLRAYNGARHDIKVVQKLLGHSSISQTESYLRKVQFDMAEEDWKRIFGGHKTDWPDPFVSLARHNLKQPNMRCFYANKRHKEKARIEKHNARVAAEQVNSELRKLRALEREKIKQQQTQQEQKEQQE